MEGMISLIEQLHRRAGPSASTMGTSNLVFAKRVACPLQEQHRDMHIGQMPRPLVGRLVGGMQRKTEENQASHLGNGAAACVWDVMRAPKDLPPANNGSPCVSRLAAATAARTVACASAGRSGRFDAASM